MPFLRSPRDRLNIHLIDDRFIYPTACHGEPIVKGSNFAACRSLLLCRQVAGAGADSCPAREGKEENPMINRVTKAELYKKETKSVLPPS